MESNEINAADTKERCLLIISCSKRKRSTHEKRPAIDVYDGPVYRTLRKRINHIRTIPVDICIISSKYGLIDANYEIESYDCKMTLNRALEQRTAILSALDGILQQRRYREIFINLGARYRLTLGRVESVVGNDTKITFSEGGIGQRTSQTLRWLDSMLVQVG